MPHSLLSFPPPVAHAPAVPAAPAVQDDLERARQSFVMTTELHLTYLCVPITETVAMLDWKRFEAMLGTLTVGGIFM